VVGIVVMSSLGLRYEMLVALAARSRAELSAFNVGVYDDIARARVFRVELRE
jgi:hypothetical protein